MSGKLFVLLVYLSPIILLILAYPADRYRMRYRLSNNIPSIKKYLKQLGMTNIQIDKLQDRGSFIQFDISYTDVQGRAHQNQGLIEFGDPEQKWHTNHYWEQPSIQWDTNGVNNKLMSLSRSLNRSHKRKCSPMKSSRNS